MCRQLLFLFGDNVNKNKKQCEWCGKDILKKLSYSYRYWEKRRFCSHSCAQKSRYGLILLKKCECCGKTIQHKNGLSHSNYKKRKYCSKSCAGKHNKSGNKFNPREMHRNWGGGFTKSNGYIKVLVGNGTYRSLHVVLVEEFLGRSLGKNECVHHCNGNKRDNRLENLELMTRSEHSRLHCTLLSDESRKKAKIAKLGKFKKETHSCWKKNVTDIDVIKAIKSNATFKEAAKKLGICPDTLRSRIKYINFKNGII